MKIPKFLLKKQSLHIQILSILAVILKIPIFFEPHWHSDEGFFSAACLALKNNLVLYKDIWSSRFPGIFGVYCFSNIFPNINFVVLKATLVIASILCIFFIYKIIAEKTNSNTALIASTLSALLLNLPVLYTNIVVEAIFALLFILSALFFIENKKNFWLGGLSLSLATLFSLQASIFSITFIIFLLFYIKDKKEFSKLLLGFALTVILMLVYLLNVNSLKEFFSQAILPYIQNLNSKEGLGFIIASNNLFTRSTIFLITGIILIIFYKTKKLTRNFFFISFISLITIYSTLFIGESYTHFLIMLVPIFSTILIILIQKELLKDLSLFILSTFCFLNLFSGGNMISFLNPISYYSNFINYITKKSDTVAYANSFNNNAYRHYYLNSYLTQTRNKYSNTYIWTDNPWIYKIAHIDNPPVKYLLSYKAAENFKQVKYSLNSNKPYLVIIDNNSTNPYLLENFILENGYLLNKSLEKYKIFSLEE